MSVSPWKGRLTGEPGQTSPDFQNWLDILVAKFNTLQSNHDTLQSDHDALSTDHDALLTSVSGYVSGFVPTRDSATELTFSAGTIIVGGADYTRSTSIQKILGTTWAEGDAAGGEFSGATIGNTDDYYAIAISKDSSPSTVDIGFDDNASGTNAPSGWTVLKEVFRDMTNSSGQIDAKTVTETAGGGVYVELDVIVLEFSDSTTGTNRVDKTLTTVPPDTLADMVWEYLNSAGAPSGDANMLVSRKDQTDTAAGTSNFTLRLKNFAGSDDENAVFINYPVRTNASRVVCYRCDSSSSELFVRAEVRGYWLERR